MTTIAEIKSALHQQVANRDDQRILQKVRAYFQSLTKMDKKTVAYNSSLKPLTVKEYRAEIQESLHQYKRRKLVSQKEMEKKL